jgi:phage terminase large subunit GpA-like protein
MNQKTADDIKASAVKHLALEWQNCRIMGCRTPVEWARQERRLGRGTGPLAGDEDIPYVPEALPWMIEPTDSAIDSGVQVTVLFFASGMGKTEVAVNVLAHSVAEDPKNIFVLYPKEESRDKFSRDVISRAIEATPALRKLFVERKSRDSGNTIGYKKFAGGSLYMTSAGSASNFRGPRAGLIYCDEVDGYPDDVDGEGDPIYLAFRRAEGFANAIKIISGTGTFEPEVKEDGTLLYRSRIHFWYDQSDKRKWLVPCRKCGERQWTKYEQIWAPSGSPEKAVYLCEVCEAEHDEKQWLGMIRKGIWTPHAEFSGIRGYWINAYSSTLPPEKGYASKLHQFYVDGQRAMKDPAAKRVWINTVKAELVPAETGEEAPPDWKAIYDRRENYDVVPKGGLVVNAGIDCQKNRLEVIWKAFGRNEESWALQQTIIPGEIQDEAIWKELENELRRTFPTEWGVNVGLNMALIDAGKWPDWVLRFLRNLRPSGSPIVGKIRACRGSSIFPHPLVSLKFQKMAGNLKGHWVGGDEAKDLIYARLNSRIDQEGTIPDGFHHYNFSFGEDYFKQLTAERVSVLYRNGEEIRRYKNEKKVRNEALDCEVYALAAFRLRKWNFDAIESDMKRAAELITAGPSNGIEPPRVLMPEPPKKRKIRRMNNPLSSILSFG